MLSVLGKYEHYKGTIYELICIATHSESGEKLVVYRNTDNEVFARPYDMFFGKVKNGEQFIPRFKKITT